MNITLIEDARARIHPYIKRTRLERSETLSKRLGTNVFVKLELFQKTGSFKVRGAFNKILSSRSEDLARGVVAVSGGNHAQAIAHASSVLGLDAVVVMPASTPKNYVEATRDYGAKIDLAPDVAAAFVTAERYKSDGRVFVHPFDDELVMAGQGTLGLEIFDDLPEVTDVLVSIGGGGLMAGVCSAIKTRKRETRVWGVETVGADAMAQALEAGHPVTLSAITSIAKTLGAPAVSESTLAAAKEYLESVTVVTDEEAAAALRFILERLKILPEPAASCTLAAADKLKGQLGSHVVLILCGGNVAVDDLCSYPR